MVSVVAPESPFDFDLDIDAPERPSRTESRRLSGARGTPRARVRGTAAYLSSSRILVARSADVSLTGAFVATANPDPVGTRAVLRLQDPQRAVVADVEVVRVSFVSQPDGSGRGMGMRFVDLDAEQRRFLAAYVAAHHGA